MMFAVINAIFAVIVTIRILMLERDVYRLNRKNQPPAIRGTARFTRQTKNGLIDIDLHS